MKKIVAAIAFLCCLSWSAQAQGEFRFGFQISPTFSWITTDDNQIDNNSSNLGLRLGMLGEKFFQEKYSILFGIGFAFNQGGTLRHTEGGNFWPNSDLSDPIYRNLPSGVNLKYSLQYIELPFALKMRTNEFGYMRAFFEIPRITIGMNTQARGDISSSNIENTSQETIEDDVNFFNLSWGLGGGVEYNVSDNTALVGGIFYQHGFLDVTKDKNAVKSSGESEDSRGTIRGITIRLGVMF